MGRWLRQLLKVIAWLVAGAGAAVLLVLTVALTGDGLVLLTARNIVLHRMNVQTGVATVTANGPDRPNAGLTGVVRDLDGRPIAGATVLVADARSVAYRARSDASGRYVLREIPPGDYRVVAVAPNYGPTATWLSLPTPSRQIGTLRWQPTVRAEAGRTMAADTSLEAPRRLTPTAGARLEFGAETLVEMGPPYPGRARRRSFTLVAPADDPFLLDANKGAIVPAPPTRSAGGVIYAPTTGGPYPAIMLIYPGLPETWEAISVALASDGFVVIAYTPLNFPDLNLDTRDLLFLTAELQAGRLSPHAAPGRQCTGGGSFSTLWTFQLVQQTDAYRCLLSLGGIGDAFLYREDWEAGRITPDPHMAPVPEMMVALGRPDSAPDIYLQLSAVEHPERFPPTLLVHGHGDRLVPVNQSELLAQRLKAAGRPVELKLYDGMEHYLDASREDPNNLDLLHLTLRFMHRHLDGP